MTYVGFWRRMGASFIDNLIIGTVLYVVNLIFFLIATAVFGGFFSVYQFEFDDLLKPAVIVFAVVVCVINVMIVWLYCAFMEASKFRGTLGKVAFEIAVVDINGERITFSQATGRYWGKHLSFLTLCIGFVVAGFSKNKQAMHDRMARTFVIDKQATTELDIQLKDIDVWLQIDEMPAADGIHHLMRGEKVSLYTGFWKRVGANLIDCIVPTIVLSVLFSLSIRLFMPLVIIAAALLVQESGYSEGLIIALIGIFPAICMVCGWLYYACMESSRLRGTLGKMLIGAAVTNLKGGRPTFAQASGRYWSKWISSLTLYVGYIMVGFTRNKQGLHDKLAKTYVLDKEALKWRRILQENQASAVPFPESEL
ncbi:RDD family protein [Paenibacillus jiagnxiensis]|uniref:RDD family protein n=1 Tax=Paenibacillus jiagnxiensis TaxID=3228926 RepID=UPI0033BDC160